MSGRLGKVIGKLKFSNLEGFLITCYIVKVSSLLLDDSSTTGRALLFILNLHYLPFSRIYVSFSLLTFVQASGNTV